MKKLTIAFLMLIIAGFVFDAFAQRNRSAMIRFYDTYIKSDLQSATYDGLSGFTLTGDQTVTGDFDITGDITLSDLFTMELHTVVAGDSALGVVFLDAADTTLKAGTGSDLVTIKDLAP